MVINSVSVLVCSLHSQVALQDLALRDGVIYHDSLVVIPIVTSEMTRVICQSGSKQDLIWMRTLSDANASFSVRAFKAFTIFMLAVILIRLHHFELRQWC
jgi:hypothetical protein